MRRLKFRRIADSLPNEPRRRRQAVIRWIYIAGVVGLAAVLGDIFVGSLFYLRSEGLVAGDPAVIAAEFPVTIRDLRVHQGDRVRAGDIAAIVSHVRDVTRPRPERPPLRVQRTYQRAARLRVQDVVHDTSRQRR